MLNFQEITVSTFLKEYWQKKPIVIRNALPGFVNTLTPEELAGLSLESDIESRIVIETPTTNPHWHLKRGPFVEKDFKSLPQTHWTLLVQGVDRIVPEVTDLLNHFNFIPQWRIDDVMISYAALYGSVGPHYDNYDVFLFQAQGRRKWSLTTKDCTTKNYIQDLDLRIMNQFHIEEEFILEEGDMLYLPPHVGHYGISQSEHCVTYSFGYRSYQGIEMMDDLSQYLSEHEVPTNLYKDPDWSNLNNSSELSDDAWKNARRLLIDVLNDDELIKSWFGCFATRPDQTAEQQLALPLEEDELIELSEFINELETGVHLDRDPCCRFAYYPFKSQLFINGCEWDSVGVTNELLCLVANNRFISNNELKPFLTHKENQAFLYDLWKLQWLQFHEPTSIGK